MKTVAIMFAIIRTFIEYHEAILLRRCQLIIKFIIYVRAAFHT